MASAEPSYSYNGQNGQEYPKGPALTNNDGTQYPAQYPVYGTQTQYMPNGVNNGYSASYTPSPDGIVSSDPSVQTQHTGLASDQSTQSYYPQTQPQQNYPNYWNYQQQPPLQADPSALSSSMNQMKLTDGVGQPNQPPPPPDLHRMNARANAAGYSQPQWPPAQQYSAQQPYYDNQGVPPPAPQQPAYPSQQPLASSQTNAVDGQWANRQPPTATPPKAQYPPQQQQQPLKQQQQVLQQQQAPQQQSQQLTNYTRYGQQRNRLNPDDMPSVVRTCANLETALSQIAHSDISNAVAQFLIN